MKQLISRLPDDLHARLKAKAADEGRSMNEIVTQALREAVGAASESERVDARMERLGLHDWPGEVATPVPYLDDVLRRNEGSGTAVSEQLERSRRQDRW